LALGVSVPYLVVRRGGACPADEGGPEREEEPAGEDLRKRKT